MIEAKTEAFAWSRITVETVARSRIAQPRVPLYPVAKRWLDAICAALLLVLLSPWMALIGLAVRLDSPGPAIFRQKRVGMWGKEFTMFKFRSMYSGADEDIHRRFAHQYIHGAARASQIGYKPSADKRITLVGKWLRRTSLDELPQLLNVLRGDMSLVGPRPAVAYEVAEYSMWHLRRLAVPPGLTGLAQISGRSGLTFDRIVRLDLEYIDRRSLAMDLVIILRTVPVVYKARCAA